MANSYTVVKKSPNFSASTDCLFSPVHIMYVRPGTKSCSAEHICSQWSVQCTWHVRFHSRSHSIVCDIGRPVVNFSIFDLCEIIK